MSTIILLVHIFLAVSIVILVLLQQGRASAGGIFGGGGGSQTVFGSRGSFSFLMKITAVLGAAFFITSTWLSVLAQREAGTNIDPSIIREQQEEVEQEQEFLEELQQGPAESPSPNEEQPIDLPTFDEQP